jgi:hypothetical protein
MSATKCGNVYAYVLPLPKAESLPPIQPTFSGNASRVLRVIKSKFPDFEPNSEPEIWFKARSMGLTDEE